MANDGMSVGSRPFSNLFTTNNNTNTNTNTGSTNRPPNWGSTGVSSFDQSGTASARSTTSSSSAGGWQALNDPYIKKGVEALKGLDSPEAKRVLEILSANRMPTKEEIKELGDEKNPGLIAKLEGQIDATALKDVEAAASMKGVIKGFLKWIEESRTKPASFGEPARFF